MIFADNLVHNALLGWGEGFGLGLAAGISYALIAGWWRPVRLVTMPTVEVLQLVPGLAWVPVAILTFGLSHASTVAMIAITAFPPVAIAGVMGVQSVDGRYVRAARMCGASSLSLLTTVLLPGALPHLLSGLRIGLGASWRVLVAAEMIVGSGDGLGYAILQSRWTLDYVSAFACIAVIASLGLAMERLFLLPLERRTLQRWGMRHGA
jgi:ABC-type nitrate/sulfonate/bicarbonate transport system permease component